VRRGIGVETPPPCRCLPSKIPTSSRWGRLGVVVSPVKRLLLRGFRSVELRLLGTWLEASVAATWVVATWVATCATVTTLPWGAITTVALGALGDPAAALWALDPVTALVIGAALKEEKGAQLGGSLIGVGKSAGPTVEEGTAEGLRFEPLNEPPDLNVGRNISHVCFRVQGPELSNVV